mgnify:CR=1 FL=1
MTGAGSALMGIGYARGDDRAVAAAEMAISSPLLEASIDGAHGVLLSIPGGSDLGLFEINEAAQLVANAARARREHHLRRGHRRRARRRGAGHGHRQVSGEADNPAVSRWHEPDTAPPRAPAASAFHPQPFSGQHGPVGGSGEVGWPAGGSGRLSANQQPPTPAAVPYGAVTSRPDTGTGCHGAVHRRARRVSRHGQPRTYGAQPARG